MYFHVFSIILSNLVNCTHLHLFATFTYFDVSRHSEHFCQFHPIAPNCTYLRLSHISTFHNILSIFANFTHLHLFATFTYFDVSRHSEHFCQFHPIAPNCTYLLLSHISTFHNILSILSIAPNCTQLHPIAPATPPPKSINKSEVQC